MSTFYIFILVIGHSQRFVQWMYPCYISMLGIVHSPRFLQQMSTFIFPNWTLAFHIGLYSECKLFIFRYHIHLGLYCERQLFIIWYWTLYIHIGLYSECQLFVVRYWSLDIHIGLYSNVYISKMKSKHSLYQPYLDVQYWNSKVEVYWKGHGAVFHGKEIVWKGPMVLNPSTTTYLYQSGEPLFVFWWTASTSRVLPVKIESIKPPRSQEGDWLLNESIPISCCCHHGAERSGTVVPASNRKKRLQLGVLFFQVVEGFIASHTPVRWLIVPLEGHQFVVYKFSKTEDQVGTKRRVQVAHLELTNPWAILRPVGEITHHFGWENAQYLTLKNEYVVK